MSKALVINLVLSDLAKSLSIDLRFISEISLKPLSSPHLFFLNVEATKPQAEFEKSIFKKNFFIKNNCFFRKNTGRQFKVKRLT